MSEARRLLVRSLDGERVVLGPDAARHAKVLRLRPGDPIVLFDGRGREADARVETIDAMGVVCTLGPVRESARPNARVVLVQGVPKGSKLDDIVRAATEAGVAAIHLATTERTISRPDEARARGRTDRLVKIAEEASRQSERADVPEIVAPAALAEVAARAPESAARLMLSPRGGAPWHAALGDRAECWIVIGPEGGLSDDEESALALAGWERATIAVPVMRVETAAPIAVAMIVDRLAR